MRAARVRAQAKINLFLYVTGREASGYHHIETLFCRIALADVVTVRLTGSARALDCRGPALPPDGLGPVDDNLAWRAALAYSSACRWPSGFAIELEKHIPARAGLGGGSADAGAVLRVLNLLNPRPLAPTALLELARPLGADVAFLTQDRAAMVRASGRGDQWRALPALPERIALVAVPTVGVSTRDAYAWLDEARGWTDRDVPATASASELPHDPSWNDVRRVAHNDLEEVVFARCPAVEETWRHVNDIASRTDPAAFSRMSGSGGGVFAILPAGLAARDAATPLGSGARVFATTTATRVEPVEPID